LIDWANTRVDRVAVPVARASLQIAVDGLNWAGPLLAVALFLLVIIAHSYFEASVVGHVVRDPERPLDPGLAPDHVEKPPLDLLVTHLDQTAFRILPSAHSPIGRGWVYVLHLRITNRGEEPVTLIPDLLLMTDPENPEKGPRNTMYAIEGALPSELDEELRRQRRLQGHLDDVRHLPVPIVIPGKGTVGGYVAFRVPELLIWHLPGNLDQKTPEMSPHPLDTDRLRFRDELTGRTHVIQPFTAFQMQRIEAMDNRIIRENRERARTAVDGLDIAILPVPSAPLNLDPYHVAIFGRNGGTLRTTRCTITNHENEPVALSVGVDVTARVSPENPLPTQWAPSDRPPFEDETLWRGVLNDRLPIDLAPGDSIQGAFALWIPPVLQESRQIDTGHTMNLVIRDERTGRTKRLPLRGTFGFDVEKVSPR